MSPDLLDYFMLLFSGEDLKPRKTSDLSILVILFFSGANICNVFQLILWVMIWKNIPHFYKWIEELQEGQTLASIPQYEFLSHKEFWVPHDLPIFNDEKHNKIL